MSCGNLNNNSGVFYPESMTLFIVLNHPKFFATERIILGLLQRFVMKLVCFNVTLATMQSNHAQYSPRKNRPRAGKKSENKRVTQSFVVLLRHGMTDWNLAGRVQGSLDESRLNEVGTEQARLAGLRLRDIPFDAVYCSPLNRARQTYRLLTEASNNSSLRNASPKFLDGLTEIEFPWQGILRRDIADSQWGRHFAAYRHSPRTFSYNGFNPVRDIERRAHSVWNELRNSGKRCSLVVAHNQTNKALMATALGLHADLQAWNQSNCCINVIALCPDQHPVLRLCNSSSPAIATAPRRRPLRRSGYTRLILHHHGPINQFESELRLGAATHLYAVGGETFASARAMVESTATPGWSPLPLEPRSRNDETLFEVVVGVLRRIRVNHSNQTVGLTSSDRRVISALFSAAFNLGPVGQKRVRSDPGGITIIDVAAIRSSNHQAARLECFNIRSSDTENALLSYTAPFEYS